ncbi:uncharacterized protein LOC133296165 [Gastrolobium bilobum]|uniref:uncharacterized protein LOC133296165 n=1 Tax=Gastrolobium bilobum TaxID=150636 RepID=UPI002AB00999|nr:uncharacterized protein LOC133296165 [Gastrolobium bilobum]
MDSSSSSHMASLPEDVTDEHPQYQTQPVSAFASVPHRPPTKSSSEKYSPVDWHVYFDKEDDVAIPESNDVFHVYMAGTEGPVVFCLHGGGYSGLSFALSASKIKEKARVVAMDLRGHGKSLTDNDLDLSVETMCNDVLAVIKELYGDSPPAIILVGHSMGGSIAVHVAARRSLSTLAGLVVVDVVEGTAMASLIHMQKILSSRMQHFSSVEKAEEGCSQKSMNESNLGYSETVIATVMNSTATVMNSTATGLLWAGSESCSETNGGLGFVVGVPMDAGAKEVVEIQGLALVLASRINGSEFTQGTFTLLAYWIDLINADKIAIA